MKERNHAGLLFLFLAAFFWSLGGLFTKSVAWDGISVAAVRSLTALIILCIIHRPFPMRLNKIKLVTEFCYFAQGLLFIVAHKLTTAANATALHYTSSLYILVFKAIATKTLPRRGGT